MDKEKKLNPTKRHSLWGLWCLAVVLVFVPVSSLPGRDKIDARPWEKALITHGEALVVDTHTDTPMKMIERVVDLGQKGQGPDKNDLDFPRMKEGGLDADIKKILGGNFLHFFEQVGEVAQGMKQ